MKSKLHLSLLAATAMLAHSASADPLPPPAPELRPIDAFIAGMMSSVLCGGMDDDQLHGNDGADTITGDLGNDLLHGPICRGLFSDTLGVVGGDGADFVTGGDGGSKARSAEQGTIFLPEHKGLTTDPLSVVAGPSPDAPVSLLTSVQYPYKVVAGPEPVQGIESDPFGYRQATPSPAPAGAPVAITGSAGNESLVDRTILQLMTNGQLWGGGGTEELWGDNGTDSVVNK